MCVYARQTGWLTGEDVGRVHHCSIRMGEAHLVFVWPKLLWSHLWINHKFFFARKWRILSRFSCFAMDGSHRRQNRFARNSGGLSLLRCRLGVQVVVDNHTIDCGLRRERWDVTMGSMPGQGPVNVWQLPSRAPKRALSHLNFVDIVKQCFRVRKRQT